MKERRTKKAIEECAKWLAGCLKMGWRKDQLDKLEEIWWQHHDDKGNLLPPNQINKKP